MARARRARPTGVVGLRSHPSSVARVGSSNSTTTCEMRPRMVSSGVLEYTHYSIGHPWLTIPYLFNVELYLARLMPATTWRTDGCAVGDSWPAVLWAWAMAVRRRASVLGLRCAACAGR